MRTTMTKLAWRARYLAAIALAGALACAGSTGCGGAKDSLKANAPSGELTADQIDADAIALLPESAVAVASVDAHAFFTSQTFGADLATLVERHLPIGEEAGFKASRDVDRVVAGTYSTQGADVVAVLVGRFDAEKIAKVAADKVKTNNGSVLVESEYAGRKVYTVANVGFCVLTAKTALVGSESALRRALDRVKGGSLKRDVTPWMLDTIQTPDAEAAFAADFATQPVASATVGSLKLPWTSGIKAARVLADFKPPGLHVAGTLSYTDAAGANQGADGLKGVARIASLVAITGAVPKLQDLSIKTADADVQLSFAVDDAGLRKLMAALPQYM
jgi:hypothetical protein